MNRAHWSLTVEKNKQVVHHDEGDMADDKFQALMVGDGLARVTTTYGRGLPYGEEKVNVTVTVACDQNEATINKAGEVTFMKALELAGDNWSILEQLAQKQKDNA